MNDYRSELQFAEAWSSMVRSAQSHALEMSAFRSARAKGLIDAESQKFTAFSPPTNKAQMDVRRAQRNDFSTRISAISHADKMAHMFPNVSSEVFDSVREFLKAPYPATGAICTDALERYSRFSSTVRRLCNSRC